MTTLDPKASNFDLQVVKEHFEKNPVYLAVPQESPMYFQILLRHARYADNLEDVKAVANKYLKPDALVIAVVKPEDAPLKVPKPGPKEIQNPTDESRRCRFENSES